MKLSPYDELMERVGGFAGKELRRDERLARYTSYRIGGPADLFLAANSTETLSRVLAEAQGLDIPITRLGGGTNVLISDRGIRGLVTRLGRGFDYRRWRVDGDRAQVEVGAASRLGKFVSETVERGFAGVEFAAGIPGTVGGGALMNAGAFGGELSEAIRQISGVTLEGEVRSIDRSELDFSYRSLALDVDLVITSIDFSLLRSSVGKLKRIVGTIQDKRKSKQPLGFPNAGSVFKNPPGQYAGRLIEQAGLKGTRVGRAQISPDHANFIINLGGASASDVHTLMERAQTAVWERSGLWLEPEVKLLGEWNEAAAVSAQT